MKKHILASLTILVAIASNCHALSDSDTKLEVEVLTSLEQFSNAYATADVETLNKMIADDYWHTNTNGGVVSREGWLAWNKSRKEKLASSESRVSKYQNSEVEVQILAPDVAVVKGINNAEGFRNGADYKLKIRFTHVWRKIDGTWQRAVFHDSKIE